MFQNYLELQHLLSVQANLQILDFQDFQMAPYLPTCPCLPEGLLDHWLLAVQVDQQVQKHQQFPEFQDLLEDLKDPRVQLIPDHPEDQQAQVNLVIQPVHCRP